MEDNENLNNDMNSSMFSSGGEDSREMSSMFGEEPNQAADNQMGSMFGAGPEPQEPNQAASMFGVEPEQQAASMFDSEIKEEPVGSHESKTEAPSMFNETPIKEEIKTPELNEEKNEEDIALDSEAKKESIQVIDEDEDEEEEEPVDNTPTGVVTVRPVKFKKFEATEPIRTIKKNLDIMQDISLHISVELGRTKLSIKEVMDFEKGSIVELDKIAGEQVEVYVNGKLVAKGEVIVIEDRFGVRITSTNVTKTIA